MHVKNLLSLSSWKFVELLFTKWYGKILTWIAFRLNKRKILKYVIDVTVSFFLYRPFYFSLAVDSMLQDYAKMKHFNESIHFYVQKVNI